MIDRRKFLLYCFTFCLVFSVLTGPGLAGADILEDLQAIPGMKVTEIDNPPPEYRGFRLEYEQPVNHDDALQETFDQHLTLLHRDSDAPMIFRTSGYFNFSDTRLTELTAMLSANQISCEHRGFGNSLPDAIECGALDIRQAASDHHRIIEALKPLYSGAWVSTGASKGGMTSLYHRFFYPKDVDATVAYVAPNSFGVKDRRYVRFLNQVGDEACREKLIALQRDTLQRREEMAALIDQWVSDNGLHLTLLPGGANQALDIAVSEFRFQFYQYGQPSDCDRIPAPGAPASEIINFINESFWLGFISDEGIDLFRSYFYQAATQLGYPMLPIRPIRKLLQYDPNDYSYYLPDSDISHFDHKAMFDVYLWVFLQANKVMLIYGENDPWTAGQFRVPRCSYRQAYSFTVPLGNHGASINKLANADKAKALAIIERWTGVTPEAVTMPLGDREMDEDNIRFRPRM